MLLSIIIVNYNVKYFLEQCLCSVQKAIQQIDAEVLVIDNASVDNSIAFLQPRFPFAQFISNAENSGYAKANNQGLAKATGRYILFLNPDTILPEDCLHECIQYMAQQPHSGALGIRMLDGSGRFLPESKRGFPSPLASLYKLSGLTFLFPRSKHIAKYYLGHLPPQKNHEVDVLAGAFMLVKKEVLDKIGGFDEQFFMYAEDVDLSYRIQQAGYTNHYFAGSSIIHFKGESTKRGSLNYVKLFYKAMSQFVKKHYTARQTWWYIVFIQMAIWARATLSAAGKILPAKKKGKVQGAINTLIIGTPSEAIHAKTILDNYTVPLRTIHRGEPGMDIKKLCTVQACHEIIFCEGAMPFKKMIDEIQRLPRHLLLRFHAAGSKSIAGSHSKNSTGDVLHL